MRVYLLTNFDAPTIGSFNPGTVPFNWFEKGYARLNQEVVSQAASVTFGPADFNERARRLTYAPPGEPVPAGQVPGFYGAELGLWPGLDGALPTMDPAAVAALKNLGLAVEANYPGVLFSIYGQWAASNGAPGLANAQVQLSAADIFPRLFKFRFVSIQLLPISLAGESLNTWLMANATRDPADATPRGWLVSPYYNDSTLQPKLQFQAELDWVLAHALPQDFLIVATNYAATDYLPSVHGPYFDAIADAGFAVVKVSEAGGTGGGGTGGVGGGGVSTPVSVLDPYTQGYDAIKEALLAWEPWTNLVKPGNRVFPRSDVDREGRKEVKTNTNDSDTPEVRLVMSGLDPSRLTNANSLWSRLVAAYPLQIFSGSRTVEKLNSICFETKRALMAAGGELGLSDLIQQWTLLPGAPINFGGRGVKGAAPIKGREQWITACTVRVVFMIPKSTLLSARNGNEPVG